MSTAITNGHGSADLGYHGGQQWQTENFVDDFSVTTNMYGPPTRAMEAAKKALAHIVHYPEREQTIARKGLSRFLFNEENQYNRILLGNGASELIDLLIRRASPGSFKTGPWDVQYKEYERSVAVHGRHHRLNNQSKEPANLICIVNPCNPTGDFKGADELSTWLCENIQDRGTVLVDESMQPWVGPHFREDSLLSRKDFIDTMLRDRGVHVYVIHSWTKIWCCPGLRIGSIVAPNETIANDCQQLQVPWSVNVMASAFLIEAVKDDDYMTRTWNNTEKYRNSQIVRLQEALQDVPESARWKFYGESFNSSIWIDMQDVATADLACELAEKAGTPVRPGKHGYERPSYVRVAVREPTSFDHLMTAWRPLLEKVKSS